MKSVDASGTKRKRFRGIIICGAVLLFLWIAVGIASEFAAPEMIGIIDHVQHGSWAQYQNIAIKVPIYDSFLADNRGILISLGRGKLRRAWHGPGWGDLTISRSDPRHPRTPEVLQAASEKLGLKFVRSHAVRMVGRNYQCYEYSNRVSFVADPLTDIWCLNPDPTVPMPRFNGSAGAVSDFYRLLESAREAASN